MPLKNKSFIFAGLCLITSLIIARTLLYEPEQKSFILMICPAGDAHHMGRTIGNTFEHSLALKWAHTLKAWFSHHTEKITIIITHDAGESPDQLQLATFANRVAPDLFLRIGFYEQNTGISALYLYHFSYGDTFIKTNSENQLFPYDQAHLFAYTNTKNYTQQFYHLLNTPTNKKLYKIHQPYQLPFKPLIGITCPALACEIGIQNTQDWQLYIEPIAQALEHIIAQQRHS